MKRQRVAGCEGAAKIRHVLRIRDTHSLFRASSSHHDRICFVNGESRDEGVINTAKTRTILQIMCSCKPHPVNQMYEFSVTWCYYGLFINATTSSSQ